ncbi:MAG: hypothetical protein ACOX60_11630 [Massiliimalia sp.]
MIRGVNKNIIEVLNPEDEYFEKIIFFLNPNTQAEQTLLSSKTDEYVTRLSNQVKHRGASFHRLRSVLSLGAAAGLGAAAVYCAQWLL